MIDLLKEHPWMLTLGIFALIQIVKIYLKKSKKGAFWRKYRSYVPYVAILLGIVVSAVFAQYFGFSDADLIKLMQDAFYVGGSAITVDQLLKLPEKMLRDKGLLPANDEDPTIPQY